MKANVHTHCTWCDGANTAKEMADAACALGFTDLGFSSHSPAPFDPKCPGVADEKKYRAEIATLRDEYAGRMTILTGMEQDYYAPVNRAEYDYIIGSVHYLPVQGNHFTAADDSLENILNARREWYGDDGFRMVKAFYELSLENARKYHPDVIGHFDVVAKYNSGDRIFVEDSPAYQSAALEALDGVLDEIVPYGGMVEVNTSALKRGLRDVPYPAPFLLCHIAQRKARVIITSDSHETATLNGCFEQAEQFVRMAGFTSVATLKDGEFIDVNL